MRLFTTLILFIALAAGGWWSWNHHPQFRNLVANYVENGDFLTLEARFTPEQIMNLHREELLADAEHSYLEPSLKFHPYLLMEVKYTQSDKKTREGVILWSMVNGEMVLNSETWEQTHGFEDTIRVNATASDFKILNALARHRGVLSKSNLEKELHLDADIVHPWIESVKQKRLITQQGDLLQLHLQNPKIDVVPQTKINHWLVTKPYNHAQRESAKYNATQLQNIAEAAFGSDFTIRNTSTVFLPVYSIEVQNPDGSVLTSFWNALNGQRIQPRYLQI
jgi:hypothetical protein